MLHFVITSKTHFFKITSPNKFERHSFNEKNVLHCFFGPYINSKKTKEYTHNNIFKSFNISCRWHRGKTNHQFLENMFIAVIKLYLW